MCIRKVNYTNVQFVIQGASNQRRVWIIILLQFMKKSSHSAVRCATLATHQNLVWDTTRHPFMREKSHSYALCAALATNLKLVWIITCPLYMVRRSKSYQKSLKLNKNIAQNHIKKTSTANHTNVINVMLNFLKKWIWHTTLHQFMRKKGLKVCRLLDCHAIFFLKQNLENQMEVHQGNKTNKCNFCNASFKEKRSLTIHAKLHEKTNHWCKMQ